METLHGNTRTYKSIYSMVDQIKSSGLVIYGAGFWGKMSLPIFALFHVTPVCFCDDDLDKQGSYLIQENVKVPIISLDEAAEKYPNAVYFAAVDGSTGNTTRRVMNSRLRERNLISEYSGFDPFRYLFLLEGGWEALNRPDKPVPTGFQIGSFKNWIVTNHMGNSGSVYFNTLIDGHPNIVTGMIPMHTLTNYYRKRLQYLEEKELVLETASQICQCFAYQFSSWSFPLSPWFLDQNGQPEKRIYIDPAKFITSLRSLLVGQGKVSYAVLVKAVYAAYANSVGKAFDPKQTYWIYSDYHMMFFDVRDLDDLLSPDDFDRLEYWYIIREPVQHLFSLLKRLWGKRQREKLNTPWVMEDPGSYMAIFSCDLGLMLEKTEATTGKPVKIVRFEDAKKRTKATMQAVSKWMDIPFDERMLSATMNGIPVYFPPSENGEKLISSNDTTAVDRKDFSAWMTSFDIFRLNLAFQNFKKAYGYECDVPDHRVFSPEFLQELYKHPFRFETRPDIAEAEVQKPGDSSSEKRSSCHEDITNLLIGYMQKDTHELITDVIRPQETEEEQ